MSLLFSLQTQRFTLGVSAWLFTQLHVTLKSLSIYQNPYLSMDPSKPSEILIEHPKTKTQRLYVAELESLLKEARKIIQASSMRHLHRDWNDRTVKALKK